MKGKAIIFSAPSGSGKTTIVRTLLTEIPSLSFSISATTRPKRPTEVDGRDYYFLSVSDFRNKILQDDLLEWEEVYAETFYGTLKSEVERIWNEGKHVIFDVDVKGGMNLKKSLGDQALSIFVKVSTVETLRERLVKRSTEDAETLEMRIKKAAAEMKEEVNFDQVILNEDLDVAIASAKQIVESFISK